MHSSMRGARWSSFVAVGQVAWKTGDVDTGGEDAPTPCAARTLWSIACAE